MAKVTFVRIIL